MTIFHRLVAASDVQAPRFIHPVLKNGVIGKSECITTEIEVSGQSREGKCEPCEDRERKLAKWIHEVGTSRASTVRLSISGNPSNAGAESETSAALISERHVLGTEPHLQHGAAELIRALE